MVQVLTRHGDRTPVSVLPFENTTWECSTVLAEKTTFNGSPPTSKIPLNPTEKDGAYPWQYGNNPFADRIWEGSCLAGQLTPKGSKQLKSLGRYLRDIYVNQLRFLPADWDRAVNKLYLRSTDVWRTQQSAASLISGFFPGSNGHDRPLPIFTYPHEIETLYPNFAVCPRAAQVELTAFQTEDYREHLRETARVRQEIDDVVGWDSRSWNVLDPYFDILKARECTQHPLPCKKGDSTRCLSDRVVAEVERHVQWEIGYLFRDWDHAMELNKLRIGVWLAEIKNTMLEVTKANIPMSKKFFYYSAHDSTITSVLGALKSEDMR
ncbi:Acid phosphatase-like protein 2 [Quaeritorhiza haematococci]|nr:Acid phosphatase-like protein 2 [Quaeritorhiza haematococci]